MPPPPSTNHLDTAVLRDVLGRFATGVVAVTAYEPDGTRPTGLAANSFASVSLEPPLVSFCVARTSGSWPLLRASDRLCVAILGEDQRDVSGRLAARGGDKFRGLAWTPATPGGFPVPDGALGWLECSVEAEHPAGDHDIVVARVHHLAAAHDGPPLVFFRSQYGAFRPVKEDGTRNGE
ncbi:flavin reductase family protein [Streptomyces abyssomicinicus]|uniref:flavin reductase family protein n=1 Tax=Streptomyces abyssomicinicus TaxID=574929 RepID=UPI00124F916D|nr:flavin reductase family protein [Streptomyces abyssomicinicus]